MAKIYKYFSHPINLCLLNGILIAIIVVLNIYFQAFCIPTTWAIIMLVICFSNTIIYPFFEKTRYRPLTSFINGISLFVFLYCVIFLEVVNLYGLVLLIAIVGLVVFIPHFFMLQLIWRNVIKPSVKSTRLYFLAGFMLCIATTLFIRKLYNDAIKSIERFEKSSYVELEKNFMTEKILGMHFIYHTRIDTYDGWRPPKHEPLLILGMWLNNRIDPLNVSLEKRLELYKKFFPNNTFKFDCSCGIEYSQNYHNDLLWKQ